jgi:hypothetical protein
VLLADHRGRLYPILGAAKVDLLARYSWLARLLG